MKIEKLERFVPHIVAAVRKNLLKFNSSLNYYDLNFANDEIESTDIKYLIAYAYHEEIGIDIHKCIRILDDYDKILKIEKGIETND